MEVSQRPPIPRVFCEKSVDFVDSKGVEVFENDKEFARVWEVRSYGERDALERLSG